MLKITFESPSVHLSHADISAGELINVFHVKRRAWDQLEYKTSKQ